MASAAPPPATATAAATRRSTALITWLAVVDGGIDACGEQRSAHGSFDLFFVQIAASAYQRWSTAARPGLLVSYRPLAAACIRDHVVDLATQNW